MIVKVEDVNRAVLRLRFLALHRLPFSHCLERTHLVAEGHRLGLGCARRMKIERRSGSTILSTTAVATSAHVLSPSHRGVGERDEEEPVVVLGVVVLEGVVEAVVVDVFEQVAELLL